MIKNFVHFVIGQRHELGLGIITPVISRDVRVTEVRRGHVRPYRTVYAWSLICSPLRLASNWMGVREFCRRVISVHWPQAPYKVIGISTHAIGRVALIQTRDFSNVRIYARAFA